VAYGQAELTVAVAEPKVRLVSLLQEEFPDDFYLEMTINPSLCYGGDVYGLLLRAADELDCYRFAMNCNGQLRFEWVRAGRMIPLTNWALSGQVQSGAPQVLRVGVWAVGGEMHFYVNGVLQFSIEKLSEREGGLGVFAVSAGDNAVTVNFSLLVVHGIEELIPPVQTP